MNELWYAVEWIQKEFMLWFNAEREKKILTFPVESFSLLNNGKDFVDEQSAEWVAYMYSQGHSFFTYTSDSVDSLSSCCFSKDTPVLWKNSFDGVHLTTFEELYNLKWEPYKKNLRIFHNGFWVEGKPIKLPNRKMYHVVTANHKDLYLSDNHINITLAGEKATATLTTDDYLAFNTNAARPIPEHDEKLTYEQGFIVGAFLGDGNFGARMRDNVIYETNFSQNCNKYQKLMKCLNRVVETMRLNSEPTLRTVYNNVYPVVISSKELVCFIQKWTNWTEGTYAHNKQLNLNCLMQSVEFRKGILDGWYNTDGGNSNRCYTASSELAKDMEVLITSLGMNSIIDISDRTDEEVIIRGQKYNRNYPLYCVRWYELSNKKTMKDIYVWNNNTQYFKIIKIEEYNYTDDIYCIERKDQSDPYFTLPNGLITHNCRLRNELQENTFSYTLGAGGIMTGSKCVMTINVNRLVQNAVREGKNYSDAMREQTARVHKYLIAFNEILKDMYKAKMLQVYDAGFISLNKQFLTVGM